MLKDRNNILLFIILSLKKLHNNKNNIREIILNTYVKLLITG